MIRSVISRTSPALFSRETIFITDITASAAQPYRQRIRRIKARFFRVRNHTAPAVSSTQAVFSSTFPTWLEIPASYCRAEEMNPLSLPKNI